MGTWAHKQKQITVICGAASAPTKLAAFDSALRSCGIGDYNLIQLSSVIPPGVKVVRDTAVVANEKEWGKRLYTVYAQNTTDKPGAKVYAGVAWVILDDDGRGLFVEHSADSEEACRKLLFTTLRDMTLGRGYVLDDYPHDFEIAGIACEKEPVCVVVAATYTVEGWH